MKKHIHNHRPNFNGKTSCSFNISKGFSLVELSIVLVILGLLTGGILTGQSLIKAAELRAVTTEFSNYQTALNGFKNKYFAIPGDMNNATLFWGKLSAHCNSDAGTAQTNGTCNGNGDGVYSEAAAASQESEMLMFWQQMALASLIEGQFTGIAGPGAIDHAIVGQNVPPSKFSGGAWDIDSGLITTGTATRYAVDLRNVIKVGIALPNDEVDGALFIPEDAWNIDKKVDDGLPGKGNVIARFWDTCTTSTANNDLTGIYQLNDKTVQCALYFKDAIK